MKYKFKRRLQINVVWSSFLYENPLKFPSIHFRLESNMAAESWLFLHFVLSGYKVPNYCDLSVANLHIPKDLSFISKFFILSNPNS